MIELTCENQPACTCLFRSLACGDTFRYPNGEKVYVRMHNQDRTGQCFALHSGETYPIDRLKPIVPVDIVATWTDRKAH